MYIKKITSVPILRQHIEYFNPVSTKKRPYPNDNIPSENPQRYPKPIRILLPSQEPLMLRLSQGLYLSSNVCDCFPIFFSMLPLPDTDSPNKTSKNIEIKYWDENEFFYEETLSGTPVQRWIQFISKFTPVRYNTRKTPDDTYRSEQGIPDDHIKNGYLQCYLDIPCNDNPEETPENLEVHITFEHHSNNTETFLNSAPSWAETPSNRKKMHPIITISEWNEQNTSPNINTLPKDDPEFLIKFRFDSDLSCCELVSLNKGRRLSGNTLMTIASKLTGLLGINRTTLHDASKIVFHSTHGTDSKNKPTPHKIEVSLRQILSLKNGASWYERYGFTIIPCRNFQGPKYKDIYQDPYYYSMSLERIRKTPLSWVKTIYLPWLVETKRLPQGKRSQLNELLSQTQLNEKAMVEDLIRLTHTKLKRDSLNQRPWLEMSLVFKGLLTHNELRTSTVHLDILNFNLALDIFHSHVLFMKEDSSNARMLSESESSPSNFDSTLKKLRIHSQTLYKNWKSLRPHLNSI